MKKKTMPQYRYARHRSEEAWDATVISISILATGFCPERIT
jgi:hypothetical protein